MYILSSIPTFRKQLSTLTKKRSDGYGSLRTDICNKLIAMLYEELLNVNDTLSDTANFKLKKIRIENSQLGIGTRSGFRLIFIIRKDRKEITLLYVYPKKGKYGEIDINNAMRKQLIKEYCASVASPVIHDVNNLLEIIR